MESKLDTLTKREQEIAELVALGMSNQEIANKLFISKRTVEIHRSHALLKLGLNHSHDILRNYMLISNKYVVQHDENQFKVYNEQEHYASVCSSLPKIQVEQIMAQKDMSSHIGWKLSLNNFSSDKPNPCPCDEKPETHKHYLFER